MRIEEINGFKLIHISYQESQEILEFGEYCDHCNKVIKETDNIVFVPVLGMQMHYDEAAEFCKSHHIPEDDINIQDRRTKATLLELNSYS